MCRPTLWSERTWRKGRRSRLKICSGIPGAGSSPAVRTKLGLDSVPDYTQWVHLVAAMLRGGFTREEAGKIAGVNYLRVFRTAVA